MLEIMPINAISWEPTKLPSFPCGTKIGCSKNKYNRFLEFNAVLVDVQSMPSNFPPQCNKTLSKRFEMPNPKPDAQGSINESKKGLHLHKLHQGLALCSAMAELKQYHSQIIKLGLQADNDAMGRIIKFCAISRNGDLGYALKIISNLLQPDAFIYNTIFRGFLQFHLSKDCIRLYLQMLQNFVTPNKFTFPPVVRACSFGNSIDEGKQVHAQILKFGYHSDGFSQNNLIHMYVSFKSLDEARKVFDKMPQRDVVSWTTLISGYSQSGCIDEARKVFEMMPEKNPASWNAMIAAYVQTDRFRSTVNEFIAGGRAHPESKEIYAKVDEMLAGIRSIGYVPETESVLHDIGEEDTENPLFYHSEKLAIGFGLLKSKPGEILRITKNLRFS
ncbi:hypothetical protein L6452_15804 [Arctium lappa]|uniref:Uncharacterized protein n=1 Tax=Arctium lappa TaxID=4217 RepID=A0ACB9CPV9_ARCLA|nr:hypothetical protein L6452_15804 [Arctium lappa]